MIPLHPTEMNMLIAAITNHLFCTLEDKDFTNLSVFLSMLSKDMFNMVALKDLCERDQRDATELEAANT